MFVFDDDFVERVAKATGLSEWQIRHAAKKFIAAGLVQDLGANLFDMPKLDPEKFAEKIAEIRQTIERDPTSPLQ
jgi:hypothetical protein